MQLGSLRRNIKKAGMFRNKHKKFGKPVAFIFLEIKKNFLAKRRIQLHFQPCKVPECPISLPNSPLHHTAATKTTLKALKRCNNMNYIVDSLQYANCYIPND